MHCPDAIARAARLAAAAVVAAQPAQAQTVPQILPIPSRTHVAAGGTIPLPFVIENPNERRLSCGLFFNYRDRPVWEGVARVDPGERLRHTAQIDTRNFAFGERPVRARLTAVVELSDERTSVPAEIVFAPLVPLQPQCRFRIRGQHRIDAGSSRSDLLAEVSLHAEGSSLRCRLLRDAASPDARWEILFLPLSPDIAAPEASHLLVRRMPAGNHAIETVSGPRPYARLESPPEAGDGRILDAIFPMGDAESVSLQIILWQAEGAATAGYCPYASTLDQARDPAYAPEFVPRATGPTHRAWVRPSGF